MFNNQSQRLTVQAEGTPVTFISFSTSPSHSDTKGTVNGFQTGSSVYLITCRVEADGAVTTGTSAGGDWNKAETRLQERVLSKAGRASCRKPHLSPLLPP